jgi:hypothetical protein
MMSLMISFRGLSVTIVGILLCSIIATAICGEPKSVEVSPCRDVSRTPPITSKCVAAAIAEEAFLKATHRQVALYRIYALDPLPSRWRFVVEEGDENHPPPEGAHWFIFINRSSGKIEVQAGR